MHSSRASRIVIRSSFYDFSANFKCANRKDNAKGYEIFV